MKNFLLMPAAKTEPLPRREQEAMDILHRLGESSVAQVQGEMSGGPTYSAVRVLLSLLVDKELVRSRKDPNSRQHLFQAKTPVKRARKGALGRMLDTFFGGSPSELVATLLNEQERQLPEEEIARIRELVEEHAKQRDLKARES